MTHYTESIRNIEMTGELLVRRLEAARIANEAEWAESTERLVQSRQVARQIVEDLDLLLDHKDEGS